MVPTLIQFAAEGDAWQVPAFRAIGLAIGLAGAALALGMIGANYMKAIGRNPEAGKAAGQIVIIAAMVEVTALLGFLAIAFFIS